MLNLVYCRSFVVGLALAVFLLDLPAQAQKNDTVAVKSEIQGTKKRVEVSLNAMPAGGALSRASILCGTISNLKSEDGWVKISAEASDKRKVEGWLHGIYENKLTSQCKNNGESGETETVGDRAAAVVARPHATQHVEESVGVLREGNEVLGGGVREARSRNPQDETHQ